MQLTINDTAITIPSTLAEFTLGQRIDYHTQYGEELRAMALSIDAMDEGMEKELEAMQYRLESALRSLSFFSNIPVEELREAENVDELLTIFFACQALLEADEESIILQKEFIWNNEVWCLYTPELKHGSEMTAGEFVDAKQMLLNLEKLGKGRWEALHALCVIYLRKQGEAYEESFLYEGSERQALMLTLPMSIALQVGFFLALSVNMSTNILAYSKSPGLSPQASGVRSIMNSMAGSTFWLMWQKPQLL